MTSKILTQNLKKFRLITFDATDTVVRFSKPPSVQYKETAEHYGISTLNEEKLMTSFKPCFRELAQQYPNFGSGSNIDWKDWWTQLVTNVLNRSSDKALDQEIVTEIAKCLVDMYATPACWTKIDGAEEIVDKIQSSRKCVGLISNTDPRIKHVLRNMGLRQFQFMLTSYEVGYMKPHREIFDAALVKSELIRLQADEALHIGNSYELDVLGAQKAGWTAVLIQNDTTKDDLPKDRNFHVFKSLKEFLDTLQTKELTWH